VIFGVAAAAAAAVIWGLVIFLYKKEMESRDPLVVNFSRLLYTSLLASPALALATPTPGLLAAAASGVVTLVVGDTLYFYAIHKVGGSVAAPIAYTYVVITQYFAYLLGESVTAWLAASSILVVVGVALLTKGGPKALDPLGLAAAAGAALTWSLGITAIKLATVGGVHPAAVAYIRALSAAALLGIYLAATKRLAVVKSKKFAAASALDLGAGSALFAFSIDYVGLAAATVIVATSPLVAQTYAKATGTEPLTPRQALGGVAIFIAVATAVLTQPHMTPSG